MAPALGLAHINGGPGCGWPPIRHVLKNISSQRPGNRLTFSSSSHIHLTEQNQTAAFAILQERGVLEAVAAIEDRQEIAARRFLNEDGGDVATIATAPEPRDGNVTPVDRRAVARTQRVIKTRRKNRGFAPPVAPMLRGNSRESRVV